MPEEGQRGTQTSQESVPLWGTEKSMSTIDDIFLANVSHMERKIKNIMAIRDMSLQIAEMWKCPYCASKTLTGANCKNCGAPEKGEKLVKV